MRLRDTFKTAFKGVTINLSRSLLTMLGIIIGVCSVVLMSAVGASMQGVILGQVSSLGAKSMVIFPGQQEGGAQAVMAGFDSITFEDYAALERLPSITNLAPNIFVTGTTSYGSEEGTPQVFGITPNFFKNQKIEVQLGRLIDENDEQGARPMALLGSETRDKFFGQANPVGKRIKIADNYYTVVGVVKPLGSQFFQSADDRIYVPYSVARNVTGQHYINQITMEATETFDVAFLDVKQLLRQRHGIVNPADDPKKDDFVVHSSEEATAILSSVSLGLTLFITMVAAISLVVGGIGIMNIMLVSVKERTREIGLRKAVGARASDILLQFLTEAVMLTFLGGCIGLLIGLFFAWLIAAFVTTLLSTYVFAISLPSVIAALAMAGGTGLIFGISPARQAAKLPPMEALRYE